MYPSLIYGLVQLWLKGNEIALKRFHKAVLRISIMARDHQKHRKNTRDHHDDDDEANIRGHQLGMGRVVYTQREKSELTMFISGSV